MARHGINSFLTKYYDQVVNGFDVYFSTLLIIKSKWRIKKFVN